MLVDDPQSGAEAEAVEVVADQGRQSVAGQGEASAFEQEAGWA